MRDWIKIARHLKKNSTAGLFSKKDKNDAERRARQDECTLKNEGKSLNQVKNTSSLTSGKTVHKIAPRRKRVGYMVGQV